MNQGPRTAGSSSGGRRRLDSATPPEYDLPTRVPRFVDVRTARRLMWATFGAWVLGTAFAASAVVATFLPAWVQRPAAGLLLVVFTLGLTHRSGGHMRLWVPLAGVLAVGAVATQWSVLLAMAAGLSAVLASVWAVVLTRPARTVLGALREVAITMVVALSGTVAVAAWNAPVNYQRFNLFVLALALALAITLVWNLGAGLHGLGRQNLWILLCVAAVILVVLVYASVLRSHGSPLLLRVFADFVIWMRETVGGVPRPVEVLIGFPALVVGVTLRSRHREGWWILVFAVVGTGVITTSLALPGAYPSYFLLSTLYSLVPGVILGLIARHLVARERGARAARAVVAPSRVEPPRLAPLR